MKKDFCIDCKYPLIRNITKGHPSKSYVAKTCKNCSRIPAPRASKRLMGSRKK